MMRRAVCLLFTLCLAVTLTACQIPGEEPAEEAQGNHASEPVEPEQASTDADDGAKQTEPEEPANAEPPKAAEDDPAMPEEITKLYQMNKIYDIVPKDSATNKNVVLLTFDDGPKEKEMIDKMIEILDKHKAKAIFFVNGYRIKQNPDLLKLLHESGQIIGNHAWDHIVLSDLKKEEIDKQIVDVQNIVKELTGSAPQFFRPPHGAGNDDIREKVKQENMLYMTWSNGSLDWDKVNKNNPEGVVQKVMEQLRPGSNILMHELPWTVEALDDLLTKLEQEGYAFVDPRSIELVAKE